MKKKLLKGSSTRSSPKAENRHSLERKRKASYASKFPERLLNNAEITYIFPEAITTKQKQKHFPFSQILWVFEKQKGANIQDEDDEMPQKKTNVSFTTHAHTHTNKQKLIR